VAKWRTEVFDDRVETANVLISKLADKAAGLSDEHKALFVEALEELQVSMEELQVAGEEMSHQSQELSAARLTAEEDRQKYLELFAEAPDAYIVTDDKGLIVEANERAGALLRIKASALIKKPLVLYVDRTDRKAFFGKLASLNGAGRIENWEIYFQPRQGRSFPGRVDVTPVAGASGEPAGFRWVIRDATEAKRREEQARLATFPELNPEPVVEVDVLGHIHYLNRAAKRLVRGLLEQGPDHPWLAGLAEIAAKLSGSANRTFEREIELDGRWFLQSISSPGPGGRLRIYGRDITARKTVEEKLRKSEQNYRALADGANSIIIRWRPDGTITYANPFTLSFFGYPEEKLVGRNVGMLIPENDSAGLDLSRLIDEIVAFPEFYASNENENVLSDGRRVWIQWTNRALRDDRGQVLEILAIGNDISRRKRAEDALMTYQTELEEKVEERTSELARSTGLLERIFASVDLAIAYMDKDFNILRVNRAFADSFGQTPEYYPGKNLFVLYPDETARAVFRGVVETGDSHVEFESPFLCGDSRPAGSSWDWSVQRVMSEGGVEGVVLTLVDVTKRVQAEEESRRLLTAVEQSAEAIVVTDMADRIVYANRTFQDLHRLERSGIIGRRYAEILGLDAEDEPFRREMKEALSRGEIWKARLTRTIDGRPDRKLDLTISPVRDEAGAIVNYAVLERDTTREHRLETSVRNLQKLDALGSLSAGIAHDFNNILAPIVINAELAAFEAEKDGPAARSLQLILEAADRGRKLVRQIIAFSRPTEQKRDIIDLAAVVRETTGFLRSSIPQSIAIVERLDVVSSMIRADPSQIGQILLNLGTNAAHAMREQGGRLTIGLSEVVVGPGMETQNPELTPGPYVRLTVEDTGSGMTPEILDRIFDPFFTTKRRGEGTGMGLTVVRGIVKSHGGAITASSTPGRGTTFDVFFPAARGRAASHPSPRQAPATGKGRILFVDDEGMLVRSVKPMLERLGYSVEATTDPVEALTLFRGRPGDFDLVITDETMPGLTGERLAQEMLRLRPGLPIILSTGFSESVREEDLPAAGIRGFIMKPFSMAEIAEKIRDVLKKT
jgi:PAS domain S-box-containing protein